MDAAKQSVRSAYGALWPSLSLGGNYGTGYTDASPLNLHDQFDLRRGGSVSLSLSIPVFNRNGTRNAIRRAELDASDARIAFDDLKQNAGLQVRSAYLEYQSAQEQLTAAQSQQRATQRALDAADVRFRSGASTLVELSQARTRHTAAESALIRARLSLQLLRVQLDYQAGGLKPAAPGN